MDRSVPNTGENKIFGNIFIPNISRAFALPLYLGVNICFSNSV